jgi:hypothetical protein
MKKKAKKAVQSAPAKAKIATPALVDETGAKKTKKAFILEFLEKNTEADMKKAMVAYHTDKANPEVSGAFFQKCWIETKGAAPKAERSKHIDVDNRERILEMYEEEQKLLGPVREYRTARLIENDPAKKADLKAKEDQAMEAVYAKNHQIRALMAEH